MRIWIFLIMAVLPSFASEMTLSDAMNRMQSGNQALKAGQAHVESAQYNYKASQGNFLPIVKLELAAQHLDRDLTLDLDGIREAMLQLHTNDAVTMQDQLTQLKGGPAMTNEQRALAGQSIYQRYDAALPHFIDTVKHQNHWLGNVTVYQPLFHGGKIYSANRIADARTKVANQEQAKKISDLNRDFARLYIQASILKESIRLRQDALNAMDSHRAKAQSLVDQGMVDRTALLRAEIALADGRTALADDQMKLESIAITLGQFMGSSEPVFPIDSLVSVPPSIESKDAYLQNLRTNHPLIATLDAQESLADKAVDVKNADFLPEIGAFGKYELNQSEVSSLEPNWVVGVKGSITLFHGGSDYYQRESAIATKREVQWMKSEVSQTLEAQFQRQLLAMEQARLRYKNLSAQEDLAKENHRFTMRRFEEGQGTSLEVVDAWLGMQKAQLERVASAGDAWLALLEIEWACGKTGDFVGLWQGVNAK